MIKDYLIIFRDFLRIWLELVLEKKSHELETIINFLIKVEWKSVEITEYHIFIKTSDRQYSLWNENKFYSWLCQGTISLLTEVNPIYSWNNGRPSKKAMWEFYKRIRMYIPKPEEKSDLKKEMLGDDE